MYTIEPKTTFQVQIICVILTFTASDKNNIGACEVVSRLAGVEKTTTYMLGKCLEERRVLKNDNGTVLSGFPKDEVQASEIDE